MIKKPFGEDWTYVYYSPDDPQFEPLASCTPAIYIFTSKPSPAAARAGTGATQTITSWTELHSPERREIAISAIADPQDGTREKTYYISINYPLKTAGVNQNDIEFFVLTTPEGSGEKARPTAEQLRSIDKNLESYLAEPEIAAKIVLAESIVKQSLSGKGYEFAFINNLEDLKLCVSYLAIALAWNGEIGTPGDRFTEWRDQAQTIYKTLFDSLKLEYDADKDDVITEDEQGATANYIRLTR